MKNSAAQFIAINLAKRAKSLNITQAEVASAIGLTQSQVSRIFDGKIKRASKALDDIAEYLDMFKHGVTLEAVKSNNELIDALAATWDGTPTHSKALATIIRSLGILNSIRSNKIA